MSIVKVEPTLIKRIKKAFPQEEAHRVLDLFESLEETPQKGKFLATIGKFVLKELKYKKFRFYFITDGHILRFGSEAELAKLLIKFVSMSKKKDQQKTIEEIKKVLRKMGFGKT